MAAPASEGAGAEPMALALFTRDARLGMQGVLESQLALSAQIERLSSELHRARASELPAVEPCTASLITSRRRVAAVNATLVQVQDRLARIEKLASALPLAGAPAGASIAPGLSTVA
ncbi:hypothetical protein KFE25_000336 [Diacronema lutheri]|uniref:Biogenesis of lysosome-related organelles complex 1 subunit 7 n=2 Tax=Diacronema lutheri TaxID=2081491 RepID=A0A8J5XX23_DIALT|nr:hypothetical protein KFE25_000336 [Diacronema lutheri]